MAIVATFVPAVADPDVWVVTGALVIGLAAFAVVMVRAERRREREAAAEAEAAADPAADHDPDGPGTLVPR